MSFLSTILALLPDNVSKKIKPVHLRTSFQYVYEDMENMSATFPPGENGQIYEIDNDLPEKIKPTDRLTENELAATSALTTLSGVLEELADIEQNKANKDASEMSSANIISWQEALAINDLSDNLQDAIIALQNADIAEANARTFADGVLDGKITTEKNRNDTQDSAIATLNSHKSSVVDKMLHYWDSTAQKWISSGLKFISGAINQLEFAGRIKADGLIINETSNAILAKEIKFKNGRFRGALADGVERGFLLDGANGIDFDSMVDIFFTDYVGWLKPATFNSASYQFYNIDRGAISIAGATSVLVDNFFTGLRYTSTATTIARQNGSSISITTSMFGKWSIFREFSIDTTITTQRIFVGCSINWISGTNPTNVAMSTLVNVLGICMESGNPNILLIHNDSTGSANIIDTGVVNNANNVYGLYMSQNYGETFITIKLKIFNKSTGNLTYWDYTILSDYSGNDLYAALWCVDSLGVTATSVTDFGILRTKRRRYL